MANQQQQEAQRNPHDVKVPPVSPDSLLAAFERHLSSRKLIPDNQLRYYAKDFLTHLALRERVSASSQNQAFNALLSRDGLN